MSTIYLSSTYEDLKEYRDAAGRALRRLNHQVVGMEDYVASDERPLEKCLKDVARCQIYIGLFAHRYGFIPKEDNPEQMSITELEYREATRLNKPRLIFLVDTKERWSPSSMDAVTGEGDRGAKITALRAELEESKLASFFKSAEHLESLVTAATALHTQQAVASPRPKAAPPEPRQIVFDLYLAHGTTDEQLAQSLANELLPEPERCVVRLSSRGLFARTASDFVDLEADLCRCAVAAVLVTPITLDQMEEDRKRVELILETLASRTGAVVALASTSECIARAAAWPFTEIMDVADYGSNPAAVASRLKPALKKLGTAMAPPAIGLPWMVVAMTEREARTLADNLAVIADRMGETLRRQFETVRVGLEEKWIERYRERREQWRPTASEWAISQLSGDAIAGLVKAQNAKLRGRRIQLQHYPFDVLMADRDELRSVYRDVAEKGCVMIVDELSLFHPDINDALQRSPMVVATQTAIITVSPFEHDSLPPHKAVRQELRQRLSGAFDRFALDFDPQCEMSVGDEYRLRRWLHQSLPATLQALRTPPPNRAALIAFADEENLEVDPAVSAGLFSPGGGL
jgi:hypothetical protein